MESTFLFIIEVIGTFAFAISGIRLAAYRRFDWFGAYTVGLVTAIGGGTLRDLLLDIDVFWMQQWFYLGVTGVALAVVIMFRKLLVSNNKMLFVFDTLGLALFVVIGIQKSLAVGYPMWVAIVMGMITGAFGGVLRDILINQEPLFFRKDIYATACVAGGLAYWGVMALGCSEIAQQLTCAIIVIVLRTCALRWNWSLPVLSYDIPENRKTKTQPQAMNHTKQIEFLKFIIVGMINTMVTLVVIFATKSLLGAQSLPVQRPGLCGRPDQLVHLEQGMGVPVERKHRRRGHEIPCRIRRLLFAAAPVCLGTDIPHTPWVRWNGTSRASPSPATGWPHSAACASTPSATSFTTGR